MLQESAASDVASDKWYSLCTSLVGESRPRRRFQALSRNPNQIQSHSPGRNQMYFLPSIQSLSQVVLRT